MKFDKQKWAAILLVLVMLLSSSCTGSSNKAESADGPAVNREVQDLASEIFKNDLNNSPISASMTVGDLSAYGVEDLAAELDQMSLDSMKQYYDTISGYLGKADNINSNLLSPDNLKLLNRIKYNLSLTLEDGKFLLDQNPVNQNMGAQIELPIALTQLPLSNEQDVKDYLSRLGQYDRLMSQLADFEREKLKNKTLMPAVIYEKVIQQCNDFIAVPPEKNVFYLFLEDQLKNIASIDETAAGGYLGECLETIKNKIVPSYQALIVALKEAQEATKTTGGLWQFADGKDYYSFIVRNETSDNITPEELHDWAQKQFDSGMSDLNSVMKQLNDKELPIENAFNLDPKYTEFNQLYDILNGIINDNFEPYSIPKVIEKTIPSYLEADLPAGFYLSLTIDGKKLGDMFLKKSTYNEVDLNSLILLGHEAIPGHHLQQSVLVSLPLTPYEKASSELAYIEGWASYCETLIAESINKDEPLYGEVLKINDDLMYALSVLMDYDLHYGGMTCDEVIGKYKMYFGDGTDKVVYRTLVSPGESIHYAYGRYIMLKLRDEARQELGDKFDIKAFHDAILKTGPCSMPELEKAVQSYILSALPEQSKLKTVFSLMNGKGK